MSTNDGTNWQYASEEIPFMPVMDFDFVTYGNICKLRVATNGRSAYETEWSILQLPSAPILVLPEDSLSEVNTKNISFVWQQSHPDVERYWCELDTTDQFITSFIDLTIVDTTYLYSDLQINKRYWWRVRAFNAAGWGSFSEVRTFDTYITSVKNEEIKIEYALMQNYPNPFNPVTNIKYALKERSLVNLVLYDVLGREVETLIYEEKEAGRHSVEFNAAELPSGIYFYRIQAGDPSSGSGQSFIETKKMVLMK